MPYKQWSPEASFDRPCFDTCSAKLQYLTLQAKAVEATNIRPII